ncbi:MAG: hypothetical protein QM669_14695 [Siphonobacter sp.]
MSATYHSYLSTSANEDFSEALAQSEVSTEPLSLTSFDKSLISKTYQEYYESTFSNKVPNKKANELDWLIEALVVSLSVFLAYCVF